MIKVWVDPHPKHYDDPNNGIRQVVFACQRHLPQFGFEIVEDIKRADLFVHHAGASTSPTVDVAHCHGLLPTAMREMNRAANQVNAQVLANIIRAKRTTVPSQWVADILRRDMRFEPDVVPWGIEPDEWVPGETKPYVLWAKGRAGDVCDTNPVNELARRMPDVQFITTFGQPDTNVTVIGPQPFAAMKQWIADAMVYLATTRETFGIQTLEAMACAVPVVGYDWAGTAELVRNGETGLLVEPGDYDALVAAIREAIDTRRGLGARGRDYALTQTWLRTVELIANVYSAALEQHPRPRASIVIPCYNYGHWVGEAIESALVQREQVPDLEIIVVDDGSTDNSLDVITRYKQDVTIIHKENGGVTSARMAGAAVAKGEFIAFLDADDQMLPGWLAVCLNAIQKDRKFGIAYTRLVMLNEHNNILDPTQNRDETRIWPPAKVDVPALLSGFNQIPTCCLIRREAFNRAGGYRQRFEPTEDGELWLKIVECGYEAICATRKPLFVYRVGHPSLSRGVKVPDYVAWHTPGRLGMPPCATPRAKGAYPVRDYDQPLIDVIVAFRGDDLALIELLDSLLAQAYPFWRVLVVGERPSLASGYPFVNYLQKRGRDVVRLWEAGLQATKAPFVVLSVESETFDPLLFSRQLQAWQATGQAQEKLIPRPWLGLLGGLEPVETLYNRLDAFNQEVSHGMPGLSGQG